MSMKWICVVRCDASMNLAAGMYERDDVASRSSELEAAACADHLVLLAGLLHAIDLNLSTRSKRAMGSLFGLENKANSISLTECRSLLRFDRI